MLRNDVHTLVRWLGSEARRVVAIFGAPFFWAALGLGLLLWTLAYQTAPIIRLDLGGSRETRLRGFDTPFLTGFNDSEPADHSEQSWYTAEAPPYRWASDRAIATFFGAGGDVWVVRVAAASGRPDGSAVESSWQIGDSPTIPLRIDARPRIYSVLGHVDAAGDLRLTTTTAPLIASSDPRTLGMVMFQIIAEPLGGAPYRPAIGILLLLAATLAGVYALARRSLGALVSADRAAFAVALACGMFAAWMLATRRMDLTVFAGIMAALTWCSYLLMIVVAALLRFGGYADAATAAGLTSVAFGARMAGMLHPYALTSDLGLHVNNLADVARGALFFTEGLPCRAGGGPQPYPPGGYLALLPGALLTGVDRNALTLLVRGGGALVESLTTALLWYLLRRAGVGRRAAVLGALLYTLAPPLLRSYSVGEMANILGQALVAPVLFWLVFTGQASSRRVVPAGAALLSVTLLSHSGITLSVGAMLAIWTPLMLADRWRDGRTTTHGAGISPWPNMAAIAAAGILALALFYSAFGYVAEARRIAQQELAAQGLICPPGDPLLSKLNWWVAGQVFGDGAPVASLILAAGVVGSIMIANSRNRAFGLMLAAGWIGAILSLGTLVVSDQPVRWTLFIYPIVCLGAGVALAVWSRRGWAGVALTAAVVTYLVWYGAADWVRQVSEYLR